ncbi:phosphodiester glycosidase family protein, partial [Patescibacteria group bacterium]
LVNHPGLLDGGNVIAENFGQTEKQMTKGTKTGIGKNGNTVFLVVARNVNMVDLAHVFKSLGATHALNLDGGGSVALWYHGYKAGPGRNLPNAVVFAY